MFQSMDLELVIQTVCHIFIFFQAETIFLNQDLEEKNENQENDDEEEDKLFWLEACYKALTWHRKNKHVQVGFFYKYYSYSKLCLFNDLCFDRFLFFFFSTIPGGCMLGPKQSPYVPKQFT